MHTDLSTTEVDGGRKWVFPQYVAGLWWRRRRFVAYALMAWLFAAPWIRINHHQAIFFDIFHGKIHFLGLTFWVNELAAVLFFVLFLFSSIIFVTVILGRVFCGWACPITVFMEFIFRPIERVLEGSGARQKQVHAREVADRLISFTTKYTLFALVALVLGNTFVAYFMGSHRLIPMIVEGPSAHWGPFLFMSISSGIIFFQYSWFREQICLFVCPYGRLQSVLLDKDSLIVAYDRMRGEPRGRLGTTHGDCVDCKLCVRVCPTGIDIRKGLQLECLHCTACVDACDSIMDKINKPRGLIRYQTEREVEVKTRRVFRPRLIIYSAVMLLSSALLFGYISTRADFRMTFHRESRDLFTLQDGDIIVNAFRVNVINQIDEEIEIHLESRNEQDLQIEIPEKPIRLQAMEKKAIHVLLKVPKEKFRGTYGLLEAKLRAFDQKGNSLKDIEVRMVGPIFK